MWEACLEAGVHCNTGTGMQEATSRTDGHRDVRTATLFHSGIGSVWTSSRIFHTQWLRSRQLGGTYPVASCAMLFMYLSLNLHTDCTAKRSWSTRCTHPVKSGFQSSSDSNLISCSIVFLGAVQDQCCTPQWCSYARHVYSGMGGRCSCLQGAVCQ